MIVAVISVRVVQMPGHEIVDVIAVGHRLMPASRSMAMSGLILRSGFAGRTAVRVLFVDRNAMLIDVTLVRVMQMPVMQIVRVSFMVDGDVTAVRAVLVIVAGMDRVIASSHPSSFPLVLSGTLARRPGENPAIDHENHSQHSRNGPNLALESASDGFGAA